MVGAAGFEPATSWSQTTRATAAPRPVAVLASLWIPAFAGMTVGMGPLRHAPLELFLVWIPAFAGMTGGCVGFGGGVLQGWSGPWVPACAGMTGGCVGFGGGVLQGWSGPWVPAFAGMTGRGVEKSLETTHLGEGSVGRGGRVRTGDLVVPNHARYRCATPRYNSFWSGFLPPRELLMAEWARKSMTIGDFAVQGMTLRLRGAVNTTSALGRLETMLTVSLRSG